MRNVLLPVLLVAAVAVPYFASTLNKDADPNDPQNNSPFSLAGYQTNSQSPTGFPQTISSLPNQGQYPNPSALHGPNQSTVVFPGNANGPDFSAAPMEFLPTGDLREVIRFDVNPNWVIQRWDRVSSVVSDQGLQGMRVVLVTGTNKHDLHGSLTYHFDKRQKLQRISFSGWSGDPSRLVKLLESQFSFKSKPTTLAGTYVGTSFARTFGTLLLKYPQVMRSNNPNQQIAVVLELNNPNSRYALSPQSKTMLDGALQR